MNKHLRGTVGAPFDPDESLESRVIESLYSCFGHCKWQADHGFLTLVDVLSGPGAGSRSRGRTALGYGLDIGKQMNEVQWLPMTTMPISGGNQMTKMPLTISNCVVYTAPNHCETLRNHQFECQTHKLKPENRNQFFEIHNHFYAIQLKIMPILRHKPVPFSPHNSFDRLNVPHNSFAGLNAPYIEFSSAFSGPGEGNQFDHHARRLFPFRFSPFP
jgi:hypothetical protein